jgi:HPt (histidine-containing phosphotransfer) domain-containing protein
VSSLLQFPPDLADPSRQLLLSLWERGLPRLQERLAELDAAASTASRGTLTHEFQSHAASTAHKLAGSLGMFGYTEATSIARELELTLESNVVEPANLCALIGALRASLAL